MGVAVDLGASLITGCAGNPIYGICKQLKLELTDVNESNISKFYQDGTLIDVDLYERMSHLWLLLEECTEVLSNCGLILPNNGESGSGDHEKKEQNEKWEKYFRELIYKQSCKISNDLNADLFDDLIKYENDNFRQNIGSKSLADAMNIILEKTKLTLKAKEKNILSWCQANSEYGSGTHLKNTSMLHWKQDEQWNMRFDGSHKFINGGYEQIVRALAANMKEKGKILFNRAVTKIKWFLKKRDGVSNGVKVYTKDGDEFVADLCLIAVPIGCLKKNEIEFVPKLPQSKIECINGMGFGNLNKVILKFSSKFWEDTIYFHYVRKIFDDEDKNENAKDEKMDFNDSNERGKCFTFWNLHKVTNEPILVALYSGDCSDAFEQMTDDEIKEDVLSVLRRIYKDNVSELVDFERTNWSKTAYAGGCYSFCSNESESNSYIDMAKPIENVLYFCGEHCCKETPDTVGGAYISGLRAAGYIDQMFQKDQSTEDVKFPFVKNAKKLEMERKNIKETDRPYSYQIDFPHKRRRDIARIYAQFKKQNPSMNKKLNQYKDAVLNEHNVVKCDDAEMENMRKSLLFDDAFNSTNILNQSQSAKIEKKENVPIELDQIKLNENKNQDENNNVDMMTTNNALLPNIKSSIDKFGTNADLVEMIDSNDEGSKTTQKKKIKKNEKKRKMTKEHKSKHQHHRHKKRRLSSSKQIDGKKVSGTSLEAKKLLKEGKEKIGLFARRHLVKALNKKEFDKEAFKIIAKKVTNKVFEDFRKRFKTSKNIKELDYDKFMSSKRKKKVEDLIKAYVKRDILNK